ncbi:MAG: hypothetical protein E7302_07435 [Butyrivibrio sp.]|nr:hypothetical protein [Butyrivibrio sp.]
MKKCLIVCWFGDFLNYFDVFLLSCAYNKGWTWLLFTDQSVSRYTVPENVIIVNTSFAALTDRINEKLKVQIKPNIKPYKLCDFRPFYGVIFHDYITDYDYWGHCDIDIIWGNLSAFFSDDLIKKYDRFLLNGHLTLYRNDDIVNNTRLDKVIRGNVDASIILNSAYNWGFDETGRYSLYRVQRASMKIYEINDSIGDISPYDGFKMVMGGRINTELKDVDNIEFNKGRLYAYFADATIEEKAYIHLQKRKILCRDQDVGDNFFIYNNSIRRSKDTSDEIEIKKMSLKETRISQLKRAFETFVKYHIVLH